MRVVKRLLRIGLIIYLGVLLLLVTLERFLVYPAPPRAEGAWEASSFGLEDAEFVSEDGTKLHGFYAEHPDPVAHLLFCHGNGEHVGFLGDYVAQLSDAMQVSVLAFDYRGYGKSEGKPFEQGVLADGLAAQQWLADRAGIEPGEIVAYGRSLGGAVAVHLAGTTGVRALIVERTFHSMVDIGASQYPWAPVRLLMRNRYPSEDWIRSFDGPLLQLHGSADQLVPIASGRKLHAASPSNDKQFIEVQGMGHNGMTPASFYDEVATLLTRLEPIAK